MSHRNGRCAGDGIRVEVIDERGQVVEAVYMREITGPRPRSSDPATAGNANHHRRRR